MKTTIVMAIFSASLSIALLVGEVKCIIKAVNCNWEPIGKSEIIYTASACTGAGCVVGYINIEDK
jgi:hypothetical protein